MSDFPSPNHGPRRDVTRPELVVIHYTAMPDFDGACARLCDAAAEVSAHWLIDRDGRVLQLVDEARRAWHAGAGTWGGRGDVNSRSIGIELVNLGDEPFPEPQMRALERLLAEILARWDLPPEAVIGHSDMAPGRKTDPGPHFDWRRLALGGLSVWPEVAAESAPGAPLAPSEVSPEAFGAALQGFGYPALELELLLAAFRLRFRPMAQGPLEARDLAMARDLARRFPVDGAGQST